MSTIIKCVAPAELLFQPADDKKSVAANPEIKFCEPSLICEPGQRFWKMSARAASPKFAILEVFILVLFLAARVRWDSQLFCWIIASASQVRRGAGRREGYKRKCVVCERTSASTARGQAFRLY